MQNVKGVGIELVDALVVSVAEEVVELVKRLGNVGVADSVDDIDHLSGVAMRHLDLVLFSVFGKRVAIIRQKSDAWQGHVHEGVGESVKLRMPVRAGVAGASGRNGDASQGDKGDDTESAGREGGAEGKRTRKQIGRSPDLKFAKLGGAILALIEVDSHFNTPGPDAGNRMGVASRHSLR